MGVLENLPSKLMTELQVKTQKKLMKMQKMKTIQTPVKKEEKPKPKIIIDCLTIDLKAHVAYSQTRN